MKKIILSSLLLLISVTATFAYSVTVQSVYYRITDKQRANLKNSQILLSGYTDGIISSDGNNMVEPNEFMKAFNFAKERNFLTVVNMPSGSTTSGIPLQLPGERRFYLLPIVQTAGEQVTGVMMTLKYEWVEKATPQYSINQGFSGTSIVVPNDKYLLLSNYNAGEKVTDCLIIGFQVK